MASSSLRYPSTLNYSQTGYTNGDAELEDAKMLRQLKIQALRVSLMTYTKLFLFINLIFNTKKRTDNSLMKKSSS